MGPRSVERGKDSHTKSFASYPELQWGRVLLNAERLVATAVSRQFVTASMGPRSVERGKTKTREAVVTSRHASMGPRSVERGKNFC